MENHRVVIPRHGGPDVLQVIEEELPMPAAGEVRVRMLAAGVSAHDLMLRRFGFPGFPRPPFTPGVDVVGVVDRLGADTAPLESGQTIGALLPREGGYSEFVCVPASAAVPIPAGVDPAEAVCVVANYLTASTMLHRAAHVTSGERILVHGAAGGVGSALLELGALDGLQMYGTASARNHEFVAALGATPIDYRNDDFVARIHALTGDGVDVVFDPIGGARQLRRSYRTLRRGGRLVWFGVAAEATMGRKVIPASLLMRLLLALIPDGRKAPMPPNVAKPNSWYRETLAGLLELLAAGKLRPMVAERIPLADAVRAHETLERGGVTGKMVLVPS